MRENGKKRMILGIGCVFIIGFAVIVAPVSGIAGGIRVKAMTSSGEVKEVPLYDGYHALIIGCSAYVSGWPELKNGTEDAREVAALLKTMGWTVSTVENPDGETLKRKIKELTFNEGKDPEKAILIWFSGHGHTMQEADGTGLGYLVPVDAPEPGIDPVGFIEKSMSLRDLEAAMRQMLAKHVLVMFDADVSGDIFEMLLPKPGSHLEERDTMPSRQLIIGGWGGDKKDSVSALKHLFLQALKEGFADFNQDRYISGEELGFYMSKKISENGGKMQQPVYGKIRNPKLNQGDFVFALAGADAEKAEEEGVDPQRTTKESPKKSIQNSLGMTFNYIPPGKFMMGSPKGEEGRENDETLHPVTLTKGFYMQTTEVTQKQWHTVMGTRPFLFLECGLNCPAEKMTWEEVQEFIKRINRMDGYGRYRLPTEAEWEYACRAGSTTPIYSGDMEILGLRNAPALDSIAWYGGNSCADYKSMDCSGWNQRQYRCQRCGPHEVGLKKPNAWGLYDMLGNVYEWCQDYFAKYPESGVTDPKGPIRGTRRIARGGSFDHYARNCRSANRSHFFSKNRNYFIGFRLAMDVIAVDSK